MEQQEAPGSMPPHALVMSVSTAFMQSQALQSAAAMGVADSLAGGPLPVTELAQAVGAKADSLRRVLRLLVALGIFEETSPGVFGNNAASELLRRGQAASMLDMVMHVGDESYRAFSKLPDALRSDHAGIAFKDMSGGLTYWEWLEQPENHEASTRFNRAMTGYSKSITPVILQEYDWSQHGGATVADIGGGVGHILASLLRQQPSMRGILYDRPPVVEEAQELWPKANPDLQGRVEMVGGDFFQSVPPADVYFLKHILHDWDDESSVKILKTLRKAAQPATRLLLCETVLPEGQQVDLSKINMDLQMLVLVGGKERTESDWRELLSAGGFELEQVVPLSSGQGMIVARPAE